MQQSAETDFRKTCKALVSDCDCRYLIFICIILWAPFLLEQDGAPNLGNTQGWKRVGLPRAQQGCILSRNHSVDGYKV